MSDSRMGEKHTNNQDTICLGDWALTKKQFPSWRPWKGAFTTQGLSSILKECRNTGKRPKPILLTIFFLYNVGVGVTVYCFGCECRGHGGYEYE